MVAPQLGQDRTGPGAQGSISHLLPALRSLEMRTWKELLKLGHGWPGGTDQ